DAKIAWYESDGGSPPSFTERVISTTADQAFSVFATDMDGDGDTDVLSASCSDDKIAWYESDGGSPPTFTERVISTTAGCAVSVFATDVDGDGDTDVLSASETDDKIAWYESDGGSPPTFTERVISTTADSAFSVFATDVDGDGDTDVLSASWNDRKITWYAHGCEGDVNADGLVDPLDFGFVLALFGCDVGAGNPNCDTADVNGDGLVDPLDSGFVLARFGTCD
ncbi:MAG: VCBS repeat-containing protein, partial [Planctomycetes bacterium]|nr:VCBS repeat-containing protein [Planctomycetota bacterium]